MYIYSGLQKTSSISDSSLLFEEDSGKFSQNTCPSMADCGGLNSSTVQWWTLTDDLCLKSLSKFAIGGLFRRMSVNVQFCQIFWQKKVVNLAAVSVRQKFICSMYIFMTSEQFSSNSHFPDNLSHVPVYKVTIILRKCF